jgi:hypothetical protein
MALTLIIVLLVCAGGSAPSSSAAQAVPLDSVAQSWMALGCERPMGGQIRWLGADATHVCYARGFGVKERAVVTIYFTSDWQVAYFDLENY